MQWILLRHDGAPVVSITPDDKSLSFLFNQLFQKWLEFDSVSLWSSF
jgi:hypothetical protein